MREDPDFDPIRQLPEFRHMLARRRFDQDYGGTWFHHENIDSRTLFALPVDRHLQACRKLQQAGFDVVAISVDAVGVNQSNLRCASVWHRPVPGREAVARIDQRRANAAIVAYELGQPDIRLTLRSARPVSFAISTLLNPCSRSSMIGLSSSRSVASSADTSSTNIAASCGLGSSERARSAIGAARLEACADWSLETLRFRAWWNLPCLRTLFSVIVRSSFHNSLPFPSSYSPRPMRTKKLRYAD